MNNYKHNIWFVGEEHTREEFLKKCARCDGIYLITKELTKHNILVCEEGRGSTILNEKEFNIYLEEKKRVLSKRK